MSTTRTTEVTESLSLVISSIIIFLDCPKVNIAMIFVFIFIIFGFTKLWN